MFLSTYIHYTSIQHEPLATTTSGSRDCHDSPLPLYRTALRLAVSAPHRVPSRPVPSRVTRRGELSRTRWRNSGVGIVERTEPDRRWWRCGGVGRGVGCACGHFDNLPLLRLAPSSLHLSLSRFVCMCVSLLPSSLSFHISPLLPPAREFLSFQSPSPSFPRVPDARTHMKIRWTHTDTCAHTRIFFSCSRDMHELS